MAKKHTKSKSKSKENLNQEASVRIAHTYAHIIVHNCCTQYSTEQF